jgi:hypothetical protein
MMGFVITLSSGSPVRASVGRFRIFDAIALNWEMGLEHPSAFMNSRRSSPSLPSGELLPAAEPVTDVFEPLQRFRHSTAPEVRAVGDRR